MQFFIHLQEKQIQHPTKVNMFVTKACIEVSYTVLYLLKMKIHRFISNIVKNSVKDCSAGTLPAHWESKQHFLFSQIALPLLRNIQKLTNHPLNYYFFLHFPQLSVRPKHSFKHIFPHPSLPPLHLLHTHNQILPDNPVAETFNIKRRKKDQII